jgi:hypothetical protein
MGYENGPQVPDPAVPQDAPQLDVVHDLQQLHHFRPVCRPAVLPSRHQAVHGCSCGGCGWNHENAASELVEGDALRIDAEPL